MRRLIVILTVLAFSPSQANAAPNSGSKKPPPPSSPIASPAEQCVLDMWDPDSVIWWERDTLRGVRVVSHDPKWTLQWIVAVNENFGGVAPRRTIQARCDQCADGRGLVAVLSFRYPAPANPALDDMIGPGAVRIVGTQLRQKSDSQSFSWGTMVGRARIYQLVWSERVVSEVMVTAVVTGCISVSGFLHEQKIDNQKPRQISFDELNEFTSAVAIEEFTPTPRPRVKKYIFDVGGQ
jgi:hypothetical protein